MARALRSGRPKAAKQIFVIQVTPAVRIARTDPHNWAVQKRVVVKEEEQWSAAGYYSNLDDALEALARKLLQSKLADQDRVALLDMAAAVREATEAIVEELQRVKFAAMKVG